MTAVRLVGYRTPERPLSGRADQNRDEGTVDSEID